MNERQIDKVDYWLSSGEDWHSLSQEQSTAEAVEVIINAADRGISIKRVLRRMAASAPQYFGTTITFAWGMWGERSASGMISAAFYAPLANHIIPQEGLTGAIEPLTETCAQMMRHTISMYEASSDPRVAIFRLLALQRTVGSTFEHLSKAISRLVCEQISQPASTLEFSDVSWIEKSIELYESGRKEESLDVIFDTIDEMLLALKFDECDLALSRLPVENLSNAQLLTVLTATLGAKEHLPNRSAFVNRVRAQLKRWNADVSSLLAGLE
jgi:hypothetical protein